MNSLDGFIERFEQMPKQEPYKLADGRTAIPIAQILSPKEVEQIEKWLRTLKDVKTAIRDGNKLLDQDGCDHEMAFDIYSSIYNKIEKIIEEVKADADTD